MIKAVVFDCFGVLTTDGWLPFKRKHFGNDEVMFRRATDLNKQFNAGLSDYRQFLRDIADLAQVPLEEVRAAIEDNVADEQLFAYIRDQLKPGYKIGVLSNAGGDWLHELFSPEQVALFDATALSYETGAIKPAPQAYRIIAGRLGVEPEECIFIDDQARYCTAAGDVGMRSVVYQNMDQMQTDLEFILGNPEK